MNGKDTLNALARRELRPGESLIYGSPPGGSFWAGAFIMPGGAICLALPMVIIIGNGVGPNDLTLAVVLSWLLPTIGVLLLWYAHYTAFTAAGNYCFITEKRLRIREKSLGGKLLDRDIPLTSIEDVSVEDDHFMGCAIGKHISMKIMNEKKPLAFHPSDVDPVMSALWAILEEE